jgi:hypothetical protein
VFDDFILNLHHNHEKRSAFVITNYHLRQLEHLHRISPHVLKDPVISFSTGFLMMKNHFTSNLISTVTGRFIDMGILQHSLAFANWMLWRPNYEKEPPPGPHVLKISDLSFGLYIWLAACGVCLVGYLLEILKFKMRRPIRKLVGLMHFLLLLRERLQHYRM